MTDWMPELGCQECRPCYDAATCECPCHDGFSEDLEPQDYRFIWRDGDLTWLGRPWTMTIRTEDSERLVTTVAEFILACTKRHQDPDAVLDALIKSGELAEAPSTLLDGLRRLKVIRRADEIPPTT